MPADADLLDLTAEIVAAHAAHSPVDIDQLPELIRSVHRTLAGLTSGQASAPAVPIQCSVALGYIVCLECGARVVVLKRHLITRHELRPEAYRARWGLPRDYPLFPPRRAEQCAAVAKRIGLARIGLAAKTPTTPAR